MPKKIFTIFMSLVLCLTAVFTMVGCAPKPFTVTFQAGAQDAYLYYVEGEEVNTDEGSRETSWKQTVTSAKEIKEPVFVRPGYLFNGWSRSLSDITGTTVVTANWTDKKTISVTFYGNGGKTEDGESTITKTYKSGIEIFDDAPEFKKAGHILKWDIDFGLINEDCMVNAVWELANYKISFVDESGAPYSDIVPIMANYGNAIPTMKEPTEDGKKFVGWVDGDGNYFDKNMCFNVEDDVTVKAVFTDQSLSVIKYDLNGGNIVATTRTYGDGEPMVIANANKKGYSFAGWTWEGNGTPLKGDEITEEMLSGDVTLIAIWGSNKFNVVFYSPNAEFEDGEETSKVVTYGQPIGAMPKLKDKEGFIFKGWFCGDELITEDTIWEIDEDCVINAEFVRVYTVKFSLTTVVRKVEILCTLKSAGDIVIPNGKTIEDVTLTITEGQTLEDIGIVAMPKADVDEPSGWDEYSSGGYWKYIDARGSSHRVYLNDKKTVTVDGVKVEQDIPDTVFNEANFPGTYESGVIVLVPHIRANWTPAY